MNKNSFSRIIAGAMSWGKWGKELTEQEMIALLKHYLTEGITTFDHADIYGSYTTEKAFGNAFTSSGIAREQIQIITKCGIQYISENRNHTVKHYNYSKSHIIWSVENSLQNLQTDYIDTLLLHRPSPLMQPEEIAEAIQYLTDNHKIKTFGVSNFSISQMQLLQAYLPVIVNQIEFSLTEHSAMHNGVLDYLMLQDCLAMAWSPLGSVFKEDTEATRRIHQQLGALLEKYTATEDQLLLAWILKHPAKIHPVIGTTNFKRISNAKKALKIDLELEDWFKILVAAQGHKVP